MDQRNQPGEQRWVRLVWAQPPSTLRPRLPAIAWFPAHIAVTLLHSQHGPWHTLTASQASFTHGTPPACPPAQTPTRYPTHLLPAHAQATQEVVSRLPETTAAEFNAAVAAAKAAFPAWRATPVPTRQRVMLKFQELIRANWVSMLLVLVVVILRLVLVLLVVVVVVSGRVLCWGRQAWFRGWWPRVPGCCAHQRHPSWRASLAAAEPAAIRGVCHASTGLEGGGT